MKNTPESLALLVDLSLSIARARETPFFEEYDQDIGELSVGMNRKKVHEIKHFLPLILALSKHFQPNQIIDYGCGKVTIVYCNPFCHSAKSLKLINYNIIILYY